MNKKELFEKDMKHIRELFDRWALACDVNYEIKFYVFLGDHNEEYSHIVSMEEE